MIHPRNLPNQSSNYTGLIFHATFYLRQVIIYLFVISFRLIWYFTRILEFNFLIICESIRYNN